MQLWNWLRTTFWFPLKHSVMNLCKIFFGGKKNGKSIPGTGMTSHHNENPEPHILSLPEQSSVVRQDGSVNSGNSTEVVPATTVVTDQNENPGPHVQSLPEQSNIHQNGNVQPKPASWAKESVTGGKKGSGAGMTKDRATQIHASSRTIAKPTTSRDEKRKAMGVVAAAGPAPRSLKAGRATGVTVSEPSTRITRSKAANLSEPSRTSTKAEQAVGVLKPSTSSTKVEKGKAEVGVTISKPSKSTTTVEKGKAEAGVTISKPSKSTTTAEKGKSKVGVTISEPSKSSAAEKGKAKIGVTISERSESSAAQKGKAEVLTNSEETTAEKEKATGVTVSERKTTTNVARHADGKGKKVETNEGKTTSSTPKPSATKEKSTAQEAKPVYYIKCKGFREESETPSEACTVCGRSLSTPGPWADGSRDNGAYDMYFENINLPDVSILPCGHVFHAQCLESITPQDQLPDPPCLFCLSNVSY